MIKGRNYEGLEEHIII